MTTDRIIIDIERNQEDEFAKREIRKDVQAKVQDRIYRGHDKGTIGKIIDDLGYEATWSIKEVDEDEKRPPIQSYDG